jgi:transcriptional regulator with XRE-family HTH domain
MAIHPSSTVAEARQVIADRLREILRDAGMTSRQLAQLASWDESKCSRLLHGRTPPSDSDIRIWCTICGVPGEIPNLIIASRNAENAYVEWRRIQRSQKRMQEVRLSLYERTRLFRFYCSDVIPWPLQTPDYMRSLMMRFNEFHNGGATDIDDAVKARVARRSYLADGTRRCRMIIEQPVLRGRFAANNVMAEQLSYLLTVRQPNLSLGIIPSSAACSHWHTETFSIYDETRVFIELVSAGVTITQPREIALYVKLFDDLAAAAVYGDRARGLIAEAITALDLYSRASSYMLLA